MQRGVRNLANFPSPSVSSATSLPCGALRRRPCAHSYDAVGRAASNSLGFASAGVRAAFNLTCSTLPLQSARYVAAPFMDAPHSALPRRAQGMSYELAWPSAAERAVLAHERLDWPGSVGCVDATPIRIPKPRRKQAAYYRHDRRCHFVNVQCVVDHAGHFRHFCFCKGARRVRSRHAHATGMTPACALARTQAELRTTRVCGTGRRYTTTRLLTSVQTSFCWETGAILVRTGCSPRPDRCCEASPSITRAQAIARSSARGRDPPAAARSRWRSSASIAICVASES